MQTQRLAGEPRIAWLNRGRNCASTLYGFPDAAGVLTKPGQRRWPTDGNPQKWTRSLAPIRQSAMRQLALAETDAQGPCVKDSKPWSSMAGSCVG